LSVAGASFSYISTDGGIALVEALHAALDDLLATDVTDLPDQTVRDGLLGLLAAENRVQAAVAAWTASFDARDLAAGDACRTTKVWLSAFGRRAHRSASAVVRRARLLRHLPRLAEAAGDGAASADHLAKVDELAGQIGVEQVAPSDQTLADVAATMHPDELKRACERIRDYVDPDGPDPMRAYERRELTLSDVGGMVAVRGQLDPEGGAALREAINALMKPPAPDDDRTAGQRRADALVDLARHALARGDLPTAGGMRPQVGLLITPETLLYSEDPAKDPADDAGAGVGADDPGPGTARGDPTAPGPAAPGLTSEVRARREGVASETPGPARAKRAQRGSAWLNWYGTIPPDTARRLVCDSDLWRIVLDPTSGLPLDVGDAHRLVPWWIRRALHTRDRGCRWPGCPTPSGWTDAHRLKQWRHHHRTRVEELVSLCRHHHVLVHEGRWRIRLDPVTGLVHVTRPDGTPYEIGPSHPWTTPTTRTDDPDGLPGAA
jgi:hypothetical protein